MILAKFGITLKLSDETTASDDRIEEQLDHANDDIHRAIKDAMRKVLNRYGVLTKATVIVEN